MSTALAPGAAPGALVPGDPAGPRALAARLDAYADSAAAAAGQLRALDAGGWVGEAAEAFRRALAQVPERLERAVGAFAEAASALRSYASVLEEAQQRAGLALARVESAEADTAAWWGRLAAHHAALATEAGGGPAAGPAPPSHDPGAPGRAAAEDLLESARADVEAAARAAAERLDRAAADAPDQPGFWASAWHAAGQFVAGAAEAGLELGELVFKLNPTYALTNPQGFVEHVVGLGQGAVYGATHRAEFAKAIVNWDLWLDNPARALGQLVPDLVLAVGTAGGGLAARGAGATRRVAGAADEVADGARTAERLAGAGDAKGVLDVDLHRAAPNVVLRTPSVESEKLQNIVDDLYRGSTNPSRVGTGTTADAIRFEIRTGRQVFGRSHIRKGEDYLRGLQNWLKANPTAPYQDRLVAQSLADDLLDALGGAP